MPHNGTTFTPIEPDWDGPSVDKTKIREPTKYRERLQLKPLRKDRQMARPAKVNASVVKKRSTQLIAYRNQSPGILLPVTAMYILFQ